MRLRICKICGEEIDLGACGQTIAKITIERDNGNQTKTDHILLCESCSLQLDTWIATKALEKVTS